MEVMNTIDFIINILASIIVVFVIPIASDYLNKHSRQDHDNINDYVFNT